MPLHQVDVPREPIERFASLLGEERFEAGREHARRFAERMRGRTVWNVNSTAVGGGVAEMLQGLVGYARGADVDVRWAVLEGNPDFFRLTKRLHNALHGSVGDGSPLGASQRETYEGVLRDNAAELLAVVEPDDLVILHDPQTVGLIPHLRSHCRAVVWRCHIGSDAVGDESARGWRFLGRYLGGADAYVFSRPRFVPDFLDADRVRIIQPTIDPFSAKNQDLSADQVRSILVHVGLLEGPMGDVPAVFRRRDGSPGRVDRAADVVRLGRAPTPTCPLVVQVSRWDRLKDPVGVLQGFARLEEESGAPEAGLVLAGPNVRAVADDPEGAQVLDEVQEAWRELPHSVRRRVHLASLPTADVEENAAIVNALQRQATVVVQKSLHEGFGLTVTEAMWKGRAVVASAVGGIQDQIVDGESGILLDDPEDQSAFASALARLLSEPDLADQLGKAARERVREHFLGLRSLLDYEDLLTELDRGRPPGEGGRGEGGRS